MTHELSWEPEGLHLKWGDTIDVQGLIASNSEMVGHREFENIRYLLWDASDITYVNLDESVVTMSAQFTAQVEQYNPNIKLAFIAKEQNLLKLIEDYMQTVIKLVPDTQHQVFSNAEDARNWALA
ncbi:MAG: hypothetical protein HUJ29_10470 [Gammaproteobacteria bacterium]|nr:hypothetical protein [Gammaproteobacteria bacterium]